MKKKQKRKSKKSDYNLDDPLDRDLSDLITNGEWKRLSEYFVFRPKDATVTMRMPEEMLSSLKTIANKEKTDYQKLIREALIEFIAKRVS